MDAIDWKQFGVAGIIIVLLFWALKLVLEVIKIIDGRREKDNDKHEEVLEKIRLDHAAELERKRQDFLTELHKIVELNNRTVKEISDNTNANIKETNSVISSIGKDLGTHKTLLDAIELLIRKNLDEPSKIKK